MKINGVFGAIFLGILLINVVLALTATQNVSVNVVTRNVAYIYSYNYNIDQKIIRTFEEMGYRVELIQENNLPINLSNYVFIYVGNDNYQKPSRIPIGNVSSVVANYYNTHELGLTDRDGASQLGSTSSLSVLKNAHPIKVYTQAFSTRRIGVPYFYLDAQNKAPELIQIAGTKLTSSGRRFGDVISYGYVGARLLNGKTLNKNLCYFGIIESQYWTPEAKQMFKDCVNFVVQSPGNVSIS